MLFFKAFLLNFLKLVKLAKEMQGHTKVVVSDAADFILKTFTGIPQQIFDPVQSVNLPIGWANASEIKGTEPSQSVQGHTTLLHVAK